MTPDMMVTTDLSGRKLAGDREPSSELLMHLAVYEHRPEIRAVVHAHPPTATGFAVAGIALDRAVLAEVVCTLGSIPIADYGTPSTSELADAVRRHIRAHDGLLLANHGALTIIYILRTMCHHRHPNQTNISMFKTIYTSGGTVAAASPRHRCVARQLGRENLLFAAKEVDPCRGCVTAALGPPLCPAGRRRRRGLGQGAGGAVEPAGGRRPRRPGSRDPGRSARGATDGGRAAAGFPVTTKFD